MVERKFDFLKDVGVGYWSDKGMTGVWFVGTRTTAAGIKLKIQILLSFSAVSNGTVA